MKNMDFSVIEKWRKKANITQAELCAAVGISERTLRDLESGSGDRKRTNAVIDSVLKMAPILSPENPDEFLNELYGIGEVSELVDHIKGRIPYAANFADSLAPLFMAMNGSTPIDCSQIISDFLAILRHDFRKITSVDTYPIFNFIAEMSLSVDNCELEPDPRTLEIMWSSLITDIKSLIQCGLSADDANPVLEMLRQGRISRDATLRLNAIRAAYYTLFDNYYSLCNEERYYMALSDIAILCVGHKRTAPYCFSLGIAITNCCDYLYLTGSQEVDNGD